jgi:hypothetical protein
MKKLIVAAILLFSFAAFAFQPEEWMEQTATLTADAAAVSGAGYIYGIVFVTDGTNAPTFVVYDNTAASGTKIVPDLPLSATPRVQTLSFDPAVAFNNGVYVDLTLGGGSVAYMVYYRSK